MMAQKRMEVKMDSHGTASFLSRNHRKVAQICCFISVDAYEQPLINYRMLSSGWFFVL